MGTANRALKPLFLSCVQCPKPVGAKRKVESALSLARLMPREDAFPVALVWHQSEGFLDCRITANQLKALLTKGDR